MTTDKETGHPFPASFEGLNVGEVKAEIQRVPKAFAKNARHRRKMLGLSQAYVALMMEAYGIRWHQTVLAKVESGDRDVKVHEAYALAAFYGVALDDLISGNYGEGGSEQGVKMHPDGMVEVVDMANERQSTRSGKRK